MRKLGAALLLVALVAGFVLPVVSASAASLPDQPTSQPGSDPWADLFDALDAWLKGLYIAFIEFVAAAVWWFEKLVALITMELMQANLWRSITTAVLDALKPIAARQIRDMAFGIPGVVGLLYVAVMLAGLLMIVPTGTQLVKIDRALLWAALIMALFFTAGQPGFDLMAMFEDLRLGAMTNMMGASGAKGIYDLLALPMQAPNTTQVSLAPGLPDRFRESYFPPPNLKPKVIQLMLFKLPLPTGGEVEVGPAITVMTETKGESIARKDLALKGYTIVFLCLIPTYVIAHFGLVFGCLAAGAIILMVFFVAMIPLGFFEFGASILSGLVKQYVYLFALTLLASTLVALMLGITAMQYPGGIPDATAPTFVAYLALMVVIGVGMTYVSKMAWEAMTGSFEVVGKVTGEIGALAFVGGTNPATEKQQEKEGGLLGKVGTAAVTMGLAAATGGSSLAIAAAGAGTMLSRTKAGSALGRGLMLAGRDSSMARNYSAAAMSGGDLVSSATGIVTANLMLDARRRRREEKEDDAGGFRKAGDDAEKEEAAKRKVASMTVERQSAQVDPRWGAAMVDAGCFLTTNMPELDRGEESYFAHKDRAAARIHLERAYGSGQTADVVLDAYDQRGQRGAQQVRQVTELAQATAIDMTQRGEQVFTEKGRASASYVQRVLGGLDQIGALQSPEDAERFGQIAGATVRRPLSDVWADPFAKHKLAGQVLNPETVETLSGDLSASLKLKEMAVKLQWDEAQLAQLFDAVRAGQAVSVRSGRPAQQEAADIIGQSMTFRDMAPAEREEAAHLATLVSRGAQIQQPIDLGSPTVALARTFDEPAMRRAMTAMESGEPGKAQNEMLRAVGTRRGALSVQQALDDSRDLRQDAEQLARILTHATSVVPASFDESGRPTAEYRDLMETCARGLPGITSGGVELFKRVADDVLWDADGLAQQSAEAAQRIVKGEGATAADDLRGIAHYFDWQEAELAEVMAASLNGMSPKEAKQSVAALSPVPAGDVPYVLATARDAARETQEGRATAQVAQATAQVAPPSGSVGETRADIAPNAREADGAIREPAAPADAARTDAADNSAIAGAMSEMAVAPSALGADVATPQRTDDRVEPVAQADAARTDATDNSDVAGAMSEMGVAPSALGADVATSQRTDDRVEPQPASDPQSTQPMIPFPFEEAREQARQADGLPASSAQAGAYAVEEPQPASDPQSTQPMIPFPFEEAHADAPPVQSPVSTEQPCTASVAPIPAPVADESDLPIIMPLDAASLMQPGAGRARKKKRGARRGTSTNDSVAEATAPGAAIPPMVHKRKL